MKKHILMSLVFAGSMVAFSAHAEEQTNTNTIKASDAQKSDEKKGDIDDEITNARMRSTLGSKSQWSFKSALGYNGGSILTPLSTVRPNYRSNNSKEVLTNLAGDVGVNYRISDGASLSFGTGVSLRAPLEGNIGENFNDPRKGSSYGKEVKRAEVSSPYLSYSHGYRAMGMQMISSASYTHYTTADATDIYNLLGYVSLDQTVLADFGTSGWSGGLSLSLGKDIAKGTFKSGGDDGYRMDYLIALYPFAEYTFNDTYSFRTVFGYMEMYKYEGQNSMIQEEPYQSMGVGISVTRDIYVYPNIQFAPKDIRSDRTNVAVSANISLF